MRFRGPANSRVNGTTGNGIPLILLLILASADLNSGPDVTYRVDILQRSLVGVAEIDGSMPALPNSPRVTVSHKRSGLVCKRRQPILDVSITFLEALDELFD